MSIEAMKLALEALEGLEASYERIKPPHYPLSDSQKKARAAITALRQAIEQAQKQEPDYNATSDARLMEMPKQEPVAHCAAGPEHCPVCLSETRSLALERAVPPQRQPLTDEEIAEIAAQGHQRWLEFARAIEAAHGIKEKNNG